jgi:hypothetical protein
MPKINIYLLDNDDDLTSVSFEPINSLKIVNETSKATIRLLNSRRQVN